MLIEIAHLDVEGVGDHLPVLGQTLRHEAREDRAQNQEEDGGPSQPRSCSNGFMSGLSGVKTHRGGVVVVSAVAVIPSCGFFGSFTFAETWLRWSLWWGRRCSETGGCQSWDRINHLREKKSLEEMGCLAIAEVVPINSKWNAQSLSN